MFPADIYVTPRLMAYVAAGTPPIPILHLRPNDQMKSTRNTKMTSVQETTTHIPGDDEVSTPKRSGWRIAGGAICKGREVDHSYVTREKITGVMRRVGIHFGKRQDGTPYGQAEVDIETNKGPERVKVDLTDLEGKEKGSSASLSFLWGLLQCAKDELIVITAAKSKEPNRFGKHATYANFYTLKPGSTIANPVAKRPRNDNEDLDTAVLRMREELKSHPAYADRPVAESDDEDGTPNTHLSALCQLAAAHNWPTPEQAPADWLSFYAMWRQTPNDVKVSLSEISDDDWGQLMLSLVGRGEQGANGKPPTWAVPKPLEAAAARLSAGGNSALD